MQGCGDEGDLVHRMSRGSWFSGGEQERRGGLQARVWACTLFAHVLMQAAGRGMYVPLLALY